jgi:PPP family 3-phenylpropionic acid transporter
MLFFIYMFFFGGVGFYMTFINVYYHDAGLSGTQIGLIAMASGLAGFGGGSLSGYLSDRTGQARIVLAVSAVGCAVVAMLTATVHAFAGFLVLACFFAIFNTAMFTLTDSVTLAVLAERSAEYGRYRLGGSIGFILTSASSGFIFERTGLIWMFPAFAIMMLIFTVLAIQLPRLPVRESVKSAQAIGVMMRNPTWMIFAGSVFLIWLASSGVFSFIAVTMKSLGASDPLIGLSSAASAMAEAPFMVMSGWFVRRLGPSRMIWVSYFAYTVRIFLYSLIRVPGWVIPLNIVNGPSYVFFWTGSIHYAAKMAPESLKATAQGLIVSATNLSSVVGVLLSGWLFDQLGPTGIYRILSLFCLAAFVLFGLGRLRKEESRI